MRRPSNILKKNGFAVVEGYAPVLKAIAECADEGNMLLCSGYKVFPDGARCGGCEDCDGGWKDNDGILWPVCPKCGSEDVAYENPRSGCGTFACCDCGHELTPEEAKVFDAWARMGDEP